MVHAERTSFACVAYHLDLTFPPNKGHRNKSTISRCEEPPSHWQSMVVQSAIMKSDSYQFKTRRLAGYKLCAGRSAFLQSIYLFFSPWHKHTITSHLQHSLNSSFTIKHEFILYVLPPCIQHIQYTHTKYKHTAEASHHIVSFEDVQIERNCFTTLSISVLKLPHCSKQHH